MLRITILCCFNNNISTRLCCVHTDCFFHRKRLTERFRNSAVLSGLGFGSLSRMSAVVEEDTDAGTGVTITVSTPQHEVTGEDEAKVAIDNADNDVQTPGLEQMEVELHEGLQYQASESSTTEMIMQRETDI